MITTKEVTYTKTVKTWHCDFCDYTIQSNKGCCGVSPVMTCGICLKHMCHKCRHFYNEDGGDYDDTVVCNVCNVAFEPAWEWALHNAGRHDDITEVAEARMKYMEEK